MDEEAEHETMYNEYKQHIINVERDVYKLDQKVTTQTKYIEATYIKELIFVNNNNNIVIVIHPQFSSVFKQFLTRSNNTRRGHTKMLLVYKIVKD